ncbi:MAG TPA: chorismate mutase [Patescibacteria group bacterium]|nr:chorismate mutase [Patescibacteria group bacterium]
MKVLEPYRARIDALDEEIVELLAKRIAIIREVGALKFRENIPAVLDDRVEAVREHAASVADELGLDPDLVRKLYTILIDYSCNLEEEIKNALASARKTGT